MAQTILTVVVEVQPASADFLRAQLAALTAAQESTPNPEDQAYDALRSAVPALHFMSMTVARDDQYDPVFVIEANFDGRPGPFWAQIEAAIGTQLREMLRLCKTPRDARGALFDAVTAPASRAPLAPLLEALSVLPSARHQGNRGLDRGRIIADGKLFAAIRDQLEVDSSFNGMAQVQIHQRLRNKLLPTFPWLNDAAESRIPWSENIGDWLRLLGFVLLIVAAFAVVGELIVAISGLVCPTLPACLGTCLGFDHQSSLGSLVGKFAALAGIGFLVVVPLAAWRLRWLEGRDASCDAPQLNPDALRAMARLEDKVTQNHMISIVHVKPGVLRMILARIAHRALGLGVRVICRNGYLGSMRTIHFAHWAFLDNGGRLMFHSNFDGSWESYLDDFIEKAHGGLTLAWTHGVGFPPTRWLLMDGATQGTKFKAWARHSMTESQFWFSAYKSYSVNQIERQARIANGLRRSVLNDQEARAWAIDL